MKDEATREQLARFFRIVDQIDQLGQKLGPLVTDVKEKNENYQASFAFGPDDYAKPEYQKHLRHNAQAYLVLEALLIAAQSPEAK